MFERWYPALANDNQVNTGRARRLPAKDEAAEHLLASTTVASPNGRTQALEGQIMPGDYVINLGSTSESYWRGANSPDRFKLRADRAIAFSAERPVTIIKLNNGEWILSVSGENEVHSAIARLEVGGTGKVNRLRIMIKGASISTRPQEPIFVDNVQFVNDWLAGTRVVGTVGTDFNLREHLGPYLDAIDPPTGIKKFDRPGDWDMVMSRLVLILYRYRNRLRHEVYDHILHRLLAPWSGHHDRGILVPYPLPVLETENHVLMIETSRYLTNQLLYLEGWNQGLHLAKFDNLDNGLAQWLLDLLKTFLQHDFWEFNSKPYQRHTIWALQNLYEFAWDKEVKLGAQNVMDYISAKTAVSSSGLRRSVPFRRLRDNAGVTQLFGRPVDAQTSRMLMLTGLIDRLPSEQVNGKDEYFAHAESDDQLLLAALGTYRVPEIVLDLLMDNAHTDYFQTFFHGDRSSIHTVPLRGFMIRGGIELYASTDGVLVSAGGAWFPSGNLDFDELPTNDYRDCANAIPTTLMPRHGIDRADFIQIVGEQDFQDRVNTGVLPGFACGFNVLIPSFDRVFENELIEIQERDGYYERVDGWTFINAGDDSPNRRARFGFHVAVHTHDLGPVFSLDGTPIMHNFGFFEVASARHHRSFQDFKRLVLSRNGGRSYDWPSPATFEYETTDGRRIEFTAPPDDKKSWCILSVNGVKTETDIGAWPLARGDIINSRKRPDDASEDGRAG